MRPGDTIAGVCCRKHLAPDVVKFQCWLPGPSLKASRMPPDVYCRSLSDETATWARQQHRFVLTMDNGTNFVCRARPKEAASLTLRWVTYRLAKIKSRPGPNRDDSESHAGCYCRGYMMSTPAAPCADTTPSFFSCGLVLSLCWLRGRLFACQLAFAYIRILRMLSGIRHVPGG